MVNTVLNPPSSPPSSLILDTVPPPSPSRSGGTFLVYQSTPLREQILEAALETPGMGFIRVSSAEEFSLQVQQSAPDVLILDDGLADWAAICRTLKSGHAHALPIVVIGWDARGEDAAVEALEAGADEYVGEPSHQNELRARIQNQLRHKRRVDTLKRVRAERDSLRFDATLDALTSVLNRKTLDRALQKLEQDDAEISLVFMDVDFFKSINDGYGHAVGDRVLAALGRLLRDHVRPSDVVGRFGGEEFVVVLRDAAPDAARRVADRIRQSISGCTIAGLPRRVTVSAGVATRAPQEPMHELIGRADLALYAAKGAGRNRVLFAPPASVLIEESFITSTDTLANRASRPPSPDEQRGHCAAE